MITLSNVPQNSTQPPPRFLFQDLFDDTACSHVGSKDKKATCERLQPGSNVSGCALEGAFNFLSPIQGCAHLIHSSPTCYNASRIQKRDSTEHFCTTLALNDLIFGAEEKLKMQINHIAKTYRPRVIFVYMTCVSSLIGEDIERIAKSMQTELGIWIVPVMSAGFLGVENLGVRIAGMTLLKTLIGRKEPLIDTAYAINLWGYGLNETQRMSYRILFERVGMRILAFFGGDEAVEAIMGAHKAKLNVLINAKSLTPVARKFEEQYGVAYVETSCFGARATCDALRVIAEQFNDGAVCRKIENMIREKNKALQETCKAFHTLFSGKKVAILLNGLFSWAYIPLLEDFGMHVVAISIENLNEDDKEKAVDLLLGKGRFMYDPNAEFEEILSEVPIDIVITDTDHCAIASRAHIPFFNIDRCSEPLFIGFEGEAALAAELSLTLQTPVFNIVYQNPPWQE